MAIQNEVPIFVAVCECPLCLTDDSVKGFKVHDGKMWWSYCFADHTQFNNEFPETFAPTDRLWFAWVNDNLCLTHRDAPRYAEYDPGYCGLVKIEFTEE